MVNHLSALPSGKGVFIDTNIFHFYLRGPEQLQESCSSLLERVERKDVIGFTSSLVLDELMYKILLKTIEDRYRRNPLDVLRKSPEQIGAQSGEVRKALSIILGIQHLNVLSVERSHLEESVEYMEQCSMLPRDAVHLAVMKTNECADIASSDNDFDRDHAVNRWTPT